MRKPRKSSGRMASKGFPNPIDVHVGQRVQPAAHAARHEPGEACRSHRPDLPAGAEIRARRQPRRLEPAVRSCSRARCADRLFLRGYGGECRQQIAEPPDGRVGDARCSPMRPSPIRWRAARPWSWCAPITRSTRSAGAQTHLRADQGPGQGLGAADCLDERLGRSIASDLITSAGPVSGVRR